MKTSRALVLAAAVATVGVFPFARPAQADTTSTVLIAAAAAIVGTLLVDSNHQNYYVNNGRHVYVSQNTATYYRSHGNSRNHGQRGDQMHRDQQHR